MGPCASISPARRSPRTCECKNLLRQEFQRNPVVAPALVGRRGAVVEEVAMVAAAAGAVVLGARVNQEIVLLLLEGSRNRGEEARPAGAGVELHLGREHRQVAAAADEDARALLVVQRARAGAL